LFKTLPTCSQVTRSTSVPHYSISSLDSGTNVLEWIIQGSGDQYIDLVKTKLYVRFNIKDGKNNIAVDAKVAPLTNFLGSMFKQCDIFLNEKLVTSSNNLYAHRAYIEQLLNYTKQTADNQLASQLFYKDTSGRFNSDEAANEGFKTRKEYAKESRMVEMEGPLFTDLTNQGRYLVNNVDIRVRLTRNSDQFCLMSFDHEGVTSGTGTNLTTTNEKKYQVYVQQAVLKVQKVTLEPGAQLSIEKMLRSQNGLYNMNRTEMKSFTIGAGDTSFTREHISLGLSPKYAIVGLVATTAMQGDFKRNPFEFQHFNLKQISMNVDGEQIPLGGINCDYQNNMHLEAYQSLVEIAGKWKSDNSFMFSREVYPQGNALYGFQLSPELIDGAFNLVRNTNIRLDLQFATQLPENVTVLVWFSYDSVLEVDSNREIHYDFSA
jgi:hypothetical protein